MSQFQGGDPYGNRTRVFAVNSKSPVTSKQSSAFAAENAPNNINGMQGRGNVCTPGEHRCLALGLWILGVMNGGPGVDMARAAAAQCEAGL